MLPQVPWFQSFRFNAKQQTNHQCWNQPTPLLLPIRKSTHISNQCQPTTLKCWQQCQASQPWGHRKQLQFLPVNAAGEKQECFCWCSGRIMIAKPVRTSTDVSNDAAISSRYYLLAHPISHLLLFSHLLSQILLSSSLQWSKQEVCKLDFSLQLCIDGFSQSRAIFLIPYFYYLSITNQLIF